LITKDSSCFGCMSNKEIDTLYRDGKLSIRFCRLCGCILEFRYNLRGCLSLVCVNEYCSLFGRFYLIVSTKRLFVDLLRAGVVLSKGSVKSVGGVL
jgi:hypothetical protein